MHPHNLNRGFETFLLIPIREHLPTLMAAVKRLLSYLKVVFQTMMKAQPVRGRLKGYDVAVQGSGAAGKWDGRPTIRCLRATAFRTFFPCRLLSITRQFVNAVKGGTAVFIATEASEPQNTTVGRYQAFNGDTV